MYDRISVGVLTLDELFSDAYQFKLPYFQRAYAWQVSHISRLLSNLEEVVAADKTHKERYFLGHLMLAEPDASGNTALVDGHQRIMSLTLLFSVLRDLETDKNRRSELHKLIEGKSGTRLRVQEHLADYCRNLVQADGATHNDLSDEDEDGLSETELNIFENREFLREALSGPDWPEAKRRELADLLRRRCQVIVAMVDSEDAAWKILQIEDETRVQFVPANEAKWSLLSIVPASARAQCHADWEYTEHLLGPESLYRLLEHIRTLKTRKRSERPVEIDIAKHYSINRSNSASDFFSNNLRPAAERVAWLRGRDTALGNISGSELAAVIDQISWINGQLWVPAALAWFATDRAMTETLEFFKKLHRLVWLMRFANLDPTKQQSRIIKLVNEIEKVGAVGSLRELEIAKATQAAALATLRGRTFHAKKYSGRVLRYISVLLGQDPGPIHSETLTIEHILPRGYVQKNAWRAYFSAKADVNSYANRLGNLTFLTPAENHSADVLDWSEKRKIYAASQIKLSRDLASVDDWTPAVIEARTERLIKVLFDAWELKV